MQCLRRPRPPVFKWRLNMKKKSLFVKYFFSYLIIGIIPFLFGFIFYYTSIPTLEREIERSQIAALDQACREIDYIKIGRAHV